MKHIHKLLPLLFVIFLTFGSAAFSQPRPPSDHGQEGDANPRPAPIGSGLTILLVLGAAYGTGKMIQHKKSGS
jgi:hypothetical protein